LPGGTHGRAYRASCTLLFGRVDLTPEVMDGLPVNGEQEVFRGVLEIVHEHV